MRTINILEDWLRYFLSRPIVQFVVVWTKTHSLPGLKKIPIYHLVQFILKEIRDDAIVTRANSMAFSFFLAIFPSIIFLVSLLPYLPYGDSFFITLQKSISELIPGNAGQWVFSTVEDLLKTEQRNLLSFGFLFTLWFSSNGMLSMMDGMRKNYSDVFKTRNLIQNRLVAIQLTILLSISLFASIVLIILGNTILEAIFHYIKVGFLTRMGIFAFRWIAIVVLFYSGISLIYRYGAPTHRKTHFFNSGATLATLLSMSVSWGFSFYANNFSNFNTIYGSIGTIIVLLLWIQINCIVLLIGFELNSGIAVIRSQNRTEDGGSNRQNSETMS